MATSPPSSSERAGDPVQLLHPQVQRWMYDQRWQRLKPIQAAAIAPILADQDVLLSAPTAGGKTEAAFLPICSRLVGVAGGSVKALQISPLKALINDQFQRLEGLCEDLDIPVHRWHGDVAASRKQALRKDPGGILLITPESLEALFVLHGPGLLHIFGGLGHIVVDELHAFIGSERGRQLQSLLHRLDLLVRRRVPRIGLSATLGDLPLAARFLRPGSNEVVILNPPGEHNQLQLRVCGYRQRPPRPDAEDELTEDQIQLADQLFRELRGQDHLIFANSRGDVERYADLLRRQAEEERVPNEFFPHHGSLAKELREDVERLLKDKTQPVSVVCTTTLELGIDVGEITSIAQIGAPWSVSSLRQRLGRSGRRAGQPAVLRVFIREPELTPQSPLLHRLRPHLVQTVAMINLLLRGWCEPPQAGALHLSTLVQQTLSLVAQYGGISAPTAYRALCVTGPFGSIDATLFTAFLHCLEAKELLQRDRQDTLLLGLQGERLVNHYSFYAAFQGPEEYTLVGEGRTLGALTLYQALTPGMYLIFAGRRWRIEAVDEERRLVSLSPARAGRVPRFETPDCGGIHDEVRQEMRRVYAADGEPVFLDPRALELLAEGREWYRQLGLAERSLLADGEDVLFFPWRGDRVGDTLTTLFAYHQQQVGRTGMLLTLHDTTLAKVARLCQKLLTTAPPSALALARSVANKRTEKHHWWLDEDLLSADYAAGRLDVAGALEALRASDPNRPPMAPPHPAP